MATFAYGLNVVSTVRESESFSGQAGNGYAADKTAFEAALATLVADGVTPTQAHVTAANNAYATFKADIAQDVVLIVNGTNAPSKNVLKAALASLMTLIAGRTNLT